MPPMLPLYVSAQQLRGQAELLSAADRVRLSNEEWYDLFAAAADLNARALPRS